jgi:hypothetical protein
MRIDRLLLAAIAMAGVMDVVTTASMAGRGQQPTAQYRIEPLADLAGSPGLSLALRKLNTIAAR